MLSKPEFDAIAAGDYATYSTLARRRARRTAASTAIALLIVAAAIAYRAVPAYRDYVLSATQDLRSTLDAHLWQPGSPYRNASNH